MLSVSVFLPHLFRALALHLGRARRRSPEHAGGDAHRQVEGVHLVVVRLPLDALQHGHDVAQQEQVFGRQQVEQPGRGGDIRNGGGRTSCVNNEANHGAFGCATSISPLDRVHLLFVLLDLHRLHPLVIQVHAQDAAGDVSQEVLVVKMKSFSLGVTESVGWL